MRRSDPSQVPLRLAGARRAPWRAALRRALGVGVLLCLAHNLAACSDGGELRLLEASGGSGGTAAGGVTSSGGATSSGGTVLVTGGTGGAVCSGSGCDCPDHSCDGPPVGCPPDDTTCVVCTKRDDCPDSKPICNQTLLHCVECTDRDQCLGLYGGEKPVCWAGKCVACSIDTDCPWPLTCDSGRCGRCNGDEDCPPDLYCHDGACSP